MNNTFYSYVREHKYLGVFAVFCIIAILLITYTIYVGKKTASLYTPNTTNIIEEELLEATSTKNKKIIKIKNIEFYADIADTIYTRAQGLSGRKVIAKDEAMFFVFEIPAQWSIWMKDMFFPIDVVWLDENKQVVHMRKNFQPSTYPEAEKSVAKSLYVIELHAGTLDELGVKEGDSIDF